MKGVNGKILRVDLTRRTVAPETPPEAFYQTYLGGRGFILHTLLNEVGPGIDPLGPENKLIFSLGPCTGHPITGSGRNSIGAKSPLTGGFGESEAGGFWGAELRRAGFDALIIEGQADRPVYLWVENGRAEIREAGKIWGKEPAEVEKALREELQDSKIKVASIGPGGERLIRYAAIMNDLSHVAARLGLGAVMGSKRLKAVAVRGNQLPPVHRKEKLLDLSREMNRTYKSKVRFWQYGTGGIMEYYETSGNLPVRNFRGGPFPGVEKTSAQYLFDQGYILKMDNCYGCPVRCKKRVKMESVYGAADPQYGGPEYEALAAFGSNCGLTDTQAIIKANELCNRFGIDSISAGACISFAMECFENGILSLQDTDGLSLTFGNAQAMLEMVKRIGNRQGLGDLLAEGTRRAAQVLGPAARPFAMETKGAELPMHEPRYRPGVGLQFSLHAAGPEHCTGIFDDFIAKYWDQWQRIGTPEELPLRELSPRKARLLYEIGLWKQLVNHLGLCFFIPWTQEQTAEIIESITGWPMSSWKLMKIAERGLTLARIFNLREGFSDDDDTLPDRFFSSPAEGPLKGLALDREKLKEAQRAYYQMLGWDEKGVPTPGKLVELGVEWASRYLPGTLKG